MPKAFKVKGFLADRETGAGLAGLRVEIWLPVESTSEPLAKSQSNDVGAFSFIIPREIVSQFDGDTLEVELRVFDRERLLFSEARELVVDAPTQDALEVYLPMDELANEGATENNAYEVVGTVRGRVADGATVRAILKTAIGEAINRQVLASAPVAASGTYSIRYVRPEKSNTAPTSLVLQLRDPNGNLLAESAPVLSPERQTKIDIRVSDSLPRLSEYALLEQHIEDQQAAGTETLDGLQGKALLEVAGWFDLEPERLMLLQSARQNEGRTGISAQLFYALGSRGLPLELEDLIDVPLVELRTTVEEAVADEIVDRSVLEGIDQTLQELGEKIVTSVLETRHPSMRSGLGEALAYADLTVDVKRHVLKRYQSRSGTAGEFWESLGQQDDVNEDLEEGVRRELEMAVELVSLVGPDPELLGRLRAQRQEGRWNSIEDLARLDFDDWCDLIEEADEAYAQSGMEEENAEGQDWDLDEDVYDDEDTDEDEDYDDEDYDEDEDYEDYEDYDEEDSFEATASEDDLDEEDEEQDWVEARANAIVDELEEAYPSVFIGREVIEAEVVSEDTRKLIERLPDHDFLNDSIRARISDDTELLEGFEQNATDIAIEEVEAIERVSRVTHHADEVAALFGMGFRSAHSIAALPRRRFNDVYGEALGGRAQASRVHAQAQQTAAASTLAMIQLLQALQQTPHVLGGGVGQAQVMRDRALKNIPDARALFGSIGLCQCEHCMSVYSPAAYLVDLLRYLDIREPERFRELIKKLRNRGYPIQRIQALKIYKPLDVLLARRPDLADIPLTCENTLTPLPYIDLVNELLEARITGKSAAHDTGKTPADVLKAVPQFVERAAYVRLQESIYPTSLPYHEPLAVARAYLGHLGVTRHQLIKTLARESNRGDPLVAEALGMPPEEFSIVVRSPNELWRHFGFASATDENTPYLNSLAQAPVFLKATGIGFNDLTELVSTRFINADNTIKLESPTPDCDPEKVRIIGLDEPRLSRMLRLLRLRRRLSWSFTDLDRALVTLGATDLDSTVLMKLVEARDLTKLLDRPIAELLGLWGSLDTWGEGNQFDRLLQTRAVAWRSKDKDTFKLRSDRTELAKTSDDLAPVVPALLAAFRITNDELSQASAIYQQRGSAPRLDLAGISAIYRIAALARALRLRIYQLAGLLRLVPPNADPFHASDPAATRRFVEIVHEVQATDFSPEKLVYLFRPVTDPRRSLAPTEAQTQAVLESIRKGLVDAFTETAQPAELSAAVLRKKLGMLLDSALVDPAMEILNPHARVTVAERRKFFDRHLARIFPNPKAAANSLFKAASESSSAQSTSTDAPKGSGTTKSEATAPSDPATGAAATAQATTQAQTLDPRWKANIAFVLKYLLPQLRTRQMRGAVVQSLSDTLGMSNQSTAWLLDTVIRSRRSAGKPLIDDFFALLGTGLTGSYFADADFNKNPVVTRTDATLEFSWAGASPAARVGGQGFGVRWTGRILTRAKAEYTFYIASDGAVRLAIKVKGKQHVLLDHSGGSKGVVEHASKSLKLDPNALYEITVEYRNKGPVASFSMRYGTAPNSKQSIPTTDLFPKSGLSSFEPVQESYLRLHKASLLVTGFEISDKQLQFLTEKRRYLDLDALPMDPDENTDPIPWFQRWRQLATLYSLRKRLPSSNTDLFEIFSESEPSKVIDTLVRATGWDKSVIGAFLGPKGFAVEEKALSLPTETSVEPFVLKLERAMNLHRRTGVASDTLFAWANTTPDADVAASIVQAVKSRYDEKRWLEVAQLLNDPLRRERRDALIDYLLPRMREQGVSQRSQLFEYFLIDVDMNPCMMSSRIKQAISAVQTFFQRCLMNLEPQVPPRLIDKQDWKWLKNYRVWEANRKVFLYPENWIEPELRDDKSPFFKELERTILQQEIKKENVESAFVDYLQKLDEVSRLDVRAVWFERRGRNGIRVLRRRNPNSRIPPRPRTHWEQGTYHIFARTFNTPHVWFYRRLERGRIWTPWEKIDADIEGDHLVPVMFQRRLHLFWTIFREKSKPSPKLASDRPPFVLGKDWEISLAYSVYDRGRWTRKQMSAGGVIDRMKLIFVAEFLADSKAKSAPRVEGSAWLPPSAYTLRATASDTLGRIRVYLYRRAVDQIRAAWSPKPQSSVELLSPIDVQLIASFKLDGCNGQLYPSRTRKTGDVGLGWRGVRKQVGNRKTFSGRTLTKKDTDRLKDYEIDPKQYQHHSKQLPSFRVARGGRLNAPPGYQVDGVGLSLSRRKGALLSLPATGSGGLKQVLGPARIAIGNVRILPVVDTAPWPSRGLAPFFYQDLRRSYFVRPVPIWAGTKIFRVLVARPLVGARAKLLVPRFGRGRRPLKRKRKRGRSRRRESLEMILHEEYPHFVLESADEGDTTRGPFSSEVIDNWEDQEDEAWHPDDAAERRRRKRKRKRKRKRSSKPAARSARTVRRAPTPPRPPAVQRLQYQSRIQSAHWEQRLRFIPFEHPQTCRLIRTLKAKGIESLLSFSTTRPSKRADHTLRNGRWLPKSSNAFSRNYKPGPLTDKLYPHLDIDFDYDNPYALYNWELFFHAPLQVAIRLAKDGRHEDAQNWFHYIFDPTADVSSPAPRRYWRFAPFHENSNYDGARELMALLSYSGDNQRLIRRQQNVEAQVRAWWENPFKPHVIARLRIVAYQKAVVMKYIDNLIEWGDKLFRRDSMESIQEATQLYILAGNILGQKPERIPPMVKVEPFTFRQVREKLDTFANWVVQFENSQVRRPFRINARPDPAGATSVLGMATQYFCIPANPNMDKQWDTVADRLFKIRNCMNIKGVVRQLPLFEPPIDPAMLVRAAAAGVDLGSVISSLNAPPPNHRFQFLVNRAVRMAEELRGFGSQMLQILERRDAEKLAALRSTNETALLESIRDIQKTKIKQVEEEVAWLALQREHVDMQMQHVVKQAQELMTPQETARQESMTEAKAIAAVAEGIDLVAKVLYAIPEIQAGGAGAFGSPFGTVQLGGQMYGKIPAALAESMLKIMNKFSTEADMAAAQAEYQQRQAELLHQAELLAKEHERLEKQISEIHLKLEISNAELRRHDTAVENSKKVDAYLRDKYTNEQLYGWMIGQLSGVYFQAYKFAFDTAKIAERAFQFERGDASAHYIEFSYWDSLKKGLYAGERLLLDIRRMEAAHLEGDQRSLEVTRHLSLRKDVPTSLQQLLATGRCEIEITEALLDRDFPGHYFRRVKTVSLTVLGKVEDYTNLNCSLTLLSNRIRVNASASGSYPQTEEGDDPRFVVNLAPVMAVAISRPISDSGMFQLRFDDDRYLPFEGAGAISTWRLELNQANNAVDLAQLKDLVLSLSYTARSGGAGLEMVARASYEKGLARGGIKPAPQHMISLKRDLPELWKQLRSAKAGQEVESQMPLTTQRFSARYKGTALRVESATVFAHARKRVDENALRIQLAPPKGSGAQVGGWTHPWPGSQTLRGRADVSGTAGAWKIKIGAKGAKVTDLFDDIVLILDLRARKAAR